MWRLNHPVRSVAIVGTTEGAAGLARAARFAGIEVRGEPLTPQAALESCLIPEGVDRLMVATAGLGYETLIELVVFGIGRGLPVWLEATTLQEVPDLLPGEAIGGRVGITLSEKAAERHLQRAVDIVAGVAAITVLLPLLVVIGVLVKLSSKGPVLHSAVVAGQNGRPFTWYKFRTMRPGGEDENRRRLQFAEFVRGGEAPAKIIDESRVTAVGAVLRRHSLDELPQLFSVLNGDMALIGPRPCLVYEYELLKPWHRRRFGVRPGLTGLWQVRGRGRVHADDMAFMDICYALGRTWWTDLRILWETVRVVLTGRGAL